MKTKSKNLYFAKSGKGPVLYWKSSGRVGMGTSNREFPPRFQSSIKYIDQTCSISACMCCLGCYTRSWTHDVIFNMLRNLFLLCAITILGRISYIDCLLLYLIQLYFTSLWIIHFPLLLHRLLSVLLSKFKLAPFLLIRWCNEIDAQPKMYDLS